MFDSKYYIPWFTKLLVSLDQRNIKNAVIVLDNAAYHKTLPDGTPRKSKSKKKDLIEACRKYGIVEHDEKETCEELWGKLSEHIKKNIPPVIVKAAREAGHEVLYSAPHYSDLEPIETVWAIVKGRVGRHYDGNTTFAIVRDRLVEALDEVSSDEVGGCIRKAHRQLDKLHKLVLKLEEQWGEIVMDSDGPSDSESDDSFYSAEEGENDD
jgi:transposase